MPDNGIKVAFLPEYPLSLMFGGAEVQFLKTRAALEKAGVRAREFSYFDRSIDYDILHVFGNPAYLSEIVSLAKGKCKIVVSVITGYQGRGRIKAMAGDVLLRYLPVKTDNRRMRDLFRKADALIALNELEKNNLVENYGCDPEKVGIVPNGVDQRFFSSGPEEFEAEYKLRDFCLCTGSICRRKNQVNLADALLRLNMQGVFIGGPVPAEQAYFKSFSDKVAASGVLKWIPFIDNDSSLLASAYAASRLVCLPSRAETQSLSALEACAARKPIVLADRPYAFQEPFVKAIRCNAEDVGDITRAVAAAAKDPERFTIRLPAEYLWDAVAGKIVNIYNNLLRKE